MKTIKTVTILALTLIHATSALATEPVCDLSITPEIVERQNQVTLHTIRGKRDNLNRPGLRFANGLIAALAAPTLTGAYLYFAELDEGRGSAASRRAETGRRGGDNSQDWYADQRQRLTLKCHDYIRDNFPQDIIEDNGILVVARHYSCSDIYTRTNHRNRLRLQIDVLYSDPVYRELDTQQIAEMKCEKINQCLVEANTPQSYSDLQEMQIQLGCM